MMVRITPDDVVQAYADTYLQPLMDGYYKPRLARASALVAVAIQKVGRYAYLNLRTLIGDVDSVSFILGLNPAYVLGYEQGWSSDEPVDQLADSVRVHSPKDAEAVRIGVMDGRAARLRVRQSLEEGSVGG